MISADNIMTLVEHEQGESGDVINDDGKVHGHQIPHNAGTSGYYHDSSFDSDVPGVHLIAFDTTDLGGLHTPTPPHSCGNEFRFEDLFMDPYPNGEMHFDPRLPSNNEEATFCESWLPRSIADNPLFDAKLQDSMQSTPHPMHGVQETSPPAQLLKAIHTQRGREALGPTSPPIPIPESKIRPARERKRGLSSPFSSPRLGRVPFLPPPVVHKSCLRTRPLRLPPLRIPPPRTPSPLPAFKTFSDSETILQAKTTRHIDMEPVFASTHALQNHLLTTGPVKPPCPLQHTTTEAGATTSDPCAEKIKNMVMNGCGSAQEDIGRSEAIEAGMNKDHVHARSGHSDSKTLAELEIFFGDTEDMEVDLAIRVCKGKGVRVKIAVV